MIRVQTEDFDVGAEINRLYCQDQEHEQNQQVGAVASFVGLVRDFYLEPAIAEQANPSLASPSQKNLKEAPGLPTGIELEHYPGMTENCLQTIVEQAQQRWSLKAVSLIHRVGWLSLGEQIVFVGVASAHRQAAFEACQFIMDYLKTQAPFWKKEISQGQQRWVEQKQRDKNALDRW